MITGVGILLTIVPIGFAILSLLTSQKLSIHEAFEVLGWAFVVVFALLPLGLGLFIGGLTWMVYLKRAIKAADEAEDEETEKPDQYVKWE
ncbi:MAG: hypothetical protein PHD76_11530 [Methylacidiphilales bacterium]|nr:hypothetical protein [Candidatus Methylacidiphilales bacterium]